MFEIDVLKKKLLSFYDALAIGCSVYKIVALPVILISLLIDTPFNIIYASIPSFIPLMQSAKDAQTAKILAFATALGIRLTAFIFRILATMAIALIVEKLFLGEQIKPLEAFKRAFSNWIGGIKTGLLMLIIVIGYTLLLIIPGIIWGIYYSFVIYIVILRNKTGKAALDYSKSLVTGNWGTLFLIYLGIGIVLGVIGGVTGALFRWLPTNFFVSLLNYSIQSIFHSFYTVIVAIVFLNFDFIKGVKNASSLAA